MCNNSNEKKLVCSCARFFDEVEKPTFVVQMQTPTEPSALYRARQFVCPSCGAVAVKTNGVYALRSDGESFMQEYDRLRRSKTEELYEVYV